MRTRGVGDSVRANRVVRPHDTGPRQSPFLVACVSIASSTGVHSAERCSCSICNAKVAYTGLVRYHASELATNERFRRTGRLTPTQVHDIARDLARLDVDHPLDPTIERVLERFGEIERARATS